MPALLSPKHEKFACLLAEGIDRIEAYKQAGYTPDRGNANRTAGRKDVRARVQELLNEAAEYTDIRRVRVLVEIDRVGSANLADFFEPTFDAEGKRSGYALKDITALPRRLTAALAGIEWDDDGRPKIKLHDKNQANFTLLKYLGGIPEPERADVNIFNVLSVEDQRALADYLEALDRGPQAPRLAASGERQPA